MPIAYHPLIKTHTISIYLIGRGSEVLTPDSFSVRWTARIGCDIPFLYELEIGTSRMFETNKQGCCGIRKSIFRQEKERKWRQEIPKEGMAKDLDSPSGVSFFPELHKSRSELQYHEAELCCDPTVQACFSVAQWRSFSVHVMRLAA